MILYYSQISKTCSDLTNKAKSINERSQLGGLGPVVTSEIDSSASAIITSGKNNLVGGTQKPSNVETGLRGEVVDKKDYFAQTEEITADNSSMLMLLRRLLKGYTYYNLF